jgi:hypothetical protein
MCFAQMRAPRRRSPKAMFMTENNTRLAEVIGRGALRLWPDLPREIQERLFETAVAGDETLRHALALYLHDHRPRTAAHSPQPLAKTQ